MKHLSIIIASTFEGGIGYQNGLPWYIPKEMKKFKNITSSVVDELKTNAVIMGRKTFETLPNPLVGRINIVISRNLNFFPQGHKVNVFVVKSMDEALQFCESNPRIESMFLIGGSVLLESFFQKNYSCSKLYLSIVYDTKLKTDTYFDLTYLYTKFQLQKDLNYEQESNDKLFASFIGIPR